MPSRVSGQRKRDSANGLPAAAAPAAWQLCCGLTLALALLLCYTLLEASLGVWWFMQLKSVGPCQADNEVGGLPEAGSTAHTAPRPPAGRLVLRLPAPLARSIAWPLPCWCTPTNPPMAARWPPCRDPGALASSKAPLPWSCSRWSKWSRGRTPPSPGPQPTRCSPAPRWQTLPATLVSGWCRDRRCRCLGHHARTALPPPQLPRPPLPVLPPSLPPQSPAASSLAARPHAPPPAAAFAPPLLPAVADPFLLQREGKLYMFYETKSAEQQKGQIGVAASEDGGRSFRHLAVVLDLPWHLSYPFVFEHEGQVGSRRSRRSRSSSSSGSLMQELGCCWGANLPEAALHAAHPIPPPLPPSHPCLACPGLPPSLPPSI